MAIEVKGSGNRYYKVDLDNVTCTCSDFLHRRSKFDKTDDRRLCKHIREAIEISSRITTSNQQSNALSKVYLDREYVSKIIDILLNVLYASGNILLCQVCGEYRRKEPMISDKIPIILVLAKDELCSEMFSILKSSGYWTVLNESHNSLDIMNDKGLNILIKIVSGEDFSYSVMYNTGSTNFMVKLESTLKRKYKQYLNENGIFDENGKKCDYELSSEEEIFNYVGLDYVEPEVR